MLALHKNLVRRQKTLGRVCIGEHFARQQRFLILCRQLLHPDPNALYLLKIFFKCCALLEHNFLPLQISQNVAWAVAGVLLCSAYPSLTPYTGAMPGIKAFVAAVFGGIGSIPGAMIGGILLGIIEILGKAYISSQMADAIVFAVLIIVLLVKPTGILGKNIQEKV